MSTHAHIAVADETGKVNAIYVHFDGYPSALGQVLYERYKSEALLRGLVAGGDAEHVKEDGSVKKAVPNEPKSFASIKEFLAYSRTAGTYGYWWQDGGLRCERHYGHQIIRLPSKRDD